VILLVLSLAAGADDRRAATALEAELRFAEAAEAWARCAEAGPPREREGCRAAAERLRPQAADGYAGWSVLSRVRRDYRTLGSEASRHEVQAALDANPTGPAAPALERWLVAEALEHGQESPLAARVASADPTDAAWVAEQTAGVRRAAHHRWIAAVGGAFTLGFVGIAAVGRPRAALAWRSAGAALVALGLVPAALATAWEPENAAPFLQNAGFVAVAVLLAPRAPAWLGALGTFGGLAALAWAHGWLGKLGVP